MQLKIPTPGGSEKLHHVSKRQPQFPHQNLSKVLTTPGGSEKLHHVYKGNLNFHIKTCPRLLPRATTLNLNDHSPLQPSNPQSLSKVKTQELSASLSFEAHIATTRILVPSYPQSLRIGHHVKKKGSTKRNNLE